MSALQETNAIADERVARTLRDARHAARISLRTLAARAGTSHATLSQYEHGHKTPSAVTFLRIIEACGFALDFELSRRVRWSDGLYRGDELEAVLRLAEAFPARHARDPKYPRFGTA